MAASLTKTQSYVNGQWAAQTSGNALTVTLVADDYLWIRQTLATTDTSVTPTLTEMLLEVVITAAQALTGVSSLSTVTASTGTQTSNQSIVITGVAAHNLTSASSGVLTANTAALLAGADSLCGAASTAGTIVTNKARAFTGVPSTSLVESASGAATANQALVLTGAAALSSIQSTSGVLSAGAVTAGASAISDITVTAGTLIALQTILDQYGYRFRNDDGTETTASFITTQNSNVTLNGGNLRLRVGIKGTNAPQGNLQLEYRFKKSGESFSEWKKAS